MWSVIDNLRKYVIVKAFKVNQGFTAGATVLAVLGLSDPTEDAIQTEILTIHNQLKLEP